MNRNNYKIDLLPILCYFLCNSGEKNMKFLIIEDNQNDLLELIDLIDNYNEKSEIEISYDIEQDYSRILDSIDHYDFVLMDIELNNNTNGVDLACKIRQQNKDIRIIFISAFTKYLIDGYNASANLYLLKPVSQDTFNVSIDSLAKDYFYQNAGFYDGRYSQDKIYYHEITYIEMIARKLHIHFVDKNEFINNDTLLKWSNHLKDYPFSQPHRAFLVNLEHIQTFNKQEIIMKNGEHLPITDIYIEQFRKDYIHFMNRGITA